MFGITILFSTKEDEALLERSKYLNARMNTRDEDSVKQKRLDRKLSYVIAIRGQTRKLLSQ